jgi:MtrB/PioB family decaheme-associated outer membrane protein
MRIALAIAAAFPLVAFAAEEDPFEFLGASDTRPLSTIVATDYAGSASLGFSYTGDDNYTFGRYNGLDEEGFNLYANVDYRDTLPDGWLGGAASYFELSAADLGLETGRGHLAVGRFGDYRVEFGIDQQRALFDFTGATPFRGSDNLVLPTDWVAAANTSDMTALQASLRFVDWDRERERYFLDIDKQFGHWSLGAELSTEDKTGVQEMGGALYIDASNGHAAVVPRPLDWTTDEVELNVGYARNALAMQVDYFYSKFDNASTSLTWQNPYGGVFGPSVDYPDGRGAMALEPDNELQRVRAFGTYVFSPTLRVRLDGSYAEGEQDSSYLPFTVNTELGPAELPRQNLDGEVTTTTFDAGVYYRPLRKLTVEANYHYEERENDSPRDGYLYTRGDAWAPDDSKFTVYNSTHDKSIDHFELEGTYRLARSTRLTLGYAYEEINRRNAAVEETEEDQYRLTLASKPLQNLDARISLEYFDRSASTYQWAQSYYALLDTQLINETPDTNRFINHPLLSQYHLANRERTGVHLTLNYLPAADWSLGLDTRWAENDYAKTDLGLEDDELFHVSLSGTWLPAEHWDVTLFYSYDYYQAQQRNRAFRGGIEKNPFETFPPLPQASDPTRDWTVEPEDTTHSVGASARWEVIPNQLDMEWEISFYDAEGKDDLGSGGAADIDTTPLPDVTSQEHRLRWLTRYHLRENLSVEGEYQFYHFEAEDWAIDGVLPDTVDKVISTGRSSADDDIHYFRVSLSYRFARRAGR